jgi:DNA-directed RNA polymerase subunit alpha
MRRVLLSSIPGAAITSVRIEGVVHEFTTIEGVKEDTMDIILNLKSVILKIEGEGSHSLYLDETGPKTVTEGDIQVPAEVEIVNPDFKICTLNGKGRLKAEMVARKGRGYVAAEHIVGYREVAGTIPLDAMFSPVVRVSYQVENTRVGQRTDYDRLILEVNTDGSINAQEALVKAAQVLSGHVANFSSLAEEEGTVEDGGIFGPPTPAGAHDKILQTPIEELELPVRVLNCLHRGGISILGQLVEKTEDDLLALRSFGARSIEDVKEKLAKKGLSLRSKEE